MIKIILVKEDKTTFAEFNPASLPLAVLLAHTKVVSGEYAAAIVWLNNQKMVSITDTIYEEDPSIHQFMKREDLLAANRNIRSSYCGVDYG